MTLRLRYAMTIFKRLAVCLLVTPACLLAQAADDPVPPTLMEASLKALRARFPTQIVVGFEELWDARPDHLPQIDLGPPGTSLAQVLERVRRLNPTYKVDLLAGGLVHAYPAHRTADPPGLLNLRLTEYFLPPDDCMEEQFSFMDSAMGALSYTPDLGKYLWEHKAAWYRAHNKLIGGLVGDFMGDCLPADHRHEPIYLNITVREALNLMAVRSLQVTRGERANTTPGYKPQTISWRYRFRRDPEADTGLGGVPVFQQF